MRDWFPKYAMAAAAPAALKQEVVAAAGAVRRAVGHPPPVPGRTPLKLLQGGQAAAPAAEHAAQAAAPAVAHAAPNAPALRSGPPPTPADAKPLQRPAQAPAAPAPAGPPAAPSDLAPQQARARTRADATFSQRMDTLPPGTDPMKAEHPGMQGYDPNKVSPELKARLTQQRQAQVARGGVQPAGKPLQTSASGMYAHEGGDVLSSSPQMLKAAALWLIQNGITKLAALSFFHELRSLAEAA